MSAVKLASRYAQSLLDLAVEQNQLEAVHQDILYCDAVLKASREFTVLLKSPIIHADKKLSIINSVLGTNVSTLTLSFFKIMVTKRREAYLVDITKEFIRQYNTTKNITPIKVKSAVELDAATLSNIVAKVKAQAHLKDTEVVTEVDESLIGGFIVQYEDKLIDASVSKNLKQLRKDLSDNKYINLVISQN
jgi:F-type H+-transporting ATPase subunit delta